MKLYYLGDLISLIPVSNKVVKSCNRGNKKDEMVIGICIEDKNKHNYKCDDKNKIAITDTGVVDVNVTGLVCLGDKLTASNIPGKAKAIRYERLPLPTGWTSKNSVVSLFQHPSWNSITPPMNRVSSIK